MVKLFYYEYVKLIIIKGLVIINTIEVDPSSNYVIGWLNFYNIFWIRINSKAKFTRLPSSIRISNQENKRCKIKVEGQNINISKIKSVWFRRTPEYMNFDFELKIDKNLKDRIERNVINEANAFYNYFISLLIKKKTLGNPNIHNLNKINQLEIAIECRLKVPETIITNQKKGIVKFFNKYNKIIIKPLHNIAFHKTNEKYFIPYTKLFRKSEIDRLPPDFKPCLIQRYIEKKYELRSFFLSGQFYTMAIFSQDNKQTSIDFRAYDEIKPNRVIPYKLPNDIQNKLRAFMKKYKLNTGSFDLIHTKNNDYIFLEVNPAGQFGMVSHPCNYFLEKKIAQYLV